MKDSGPLHNCRSGLERLTLASQLKPVCFRNVLAMLAGERIGRWLASGRWL